jgi:capsid assembly protease
MNDLIRAEVMAQAALEAWAILPSALRAALLNSAPESIVEAPSEAIEVEALSRPGPKSGRVARVPIVGAITRRDSLWSTLFGGGASVERITKTLREVAADDSIGTVLLDIDSPGGTVSGMPELAAEVRNLKQSKHVVALANSLTASAAYWIASQADEIVATPEAVVGSVGVFSIHEDWSKFNARFGVEPTYIFAGKYKVEGNPDAPLSDDARAHLQTMVNEAYDLFVADVAKGRGVAPSVVRSEYGEGRALTAKAAKANGLVDRISSATDTLQRLAGIKAEDDGFPASSRNDNEVNSQAQLALKRRRLALAQKLYQED